MIEEIAFLPIIEGKEAEFELAIGRGIDQILSKLNGVISINLRRGVESPSTYALLIQWESIEDHTVGFVQSPAFEEWGSIVGSFFSGAPTVEHWTPINFS